MSKHKHAEVIKAWADGATIEVMVGGEWCQASTPLWSEETPYRVKPAKVYPVTQMTEVELSKANDLHYGCSRTVANAALRHAIDAGQVVSINEVLAEVDRVIGVRRAARDMAIGKAVLADFRANGIYIDADLAEIIAQVKP